MSSGKSAPPSVKTFFIQKKDLLGLRPVAGRKGFSRAIGIFSSKKQSLSILLLGKTSLQSIMSLSLRKKKAYLESLLEGKIACIVLAGSMTPPPELKLKAEEKGLTLFVSSAPFRFCQRAIRDFLSQSLPKELLVPGGMLQVFGLGVLIVGDSGIGKSESALELVTRGHRFVSDDVTLFTAEKGLVGSAPDFSRNFMEIRGLGIINIKEIFGPDSLCPSVQLDLVIQLKRWEEGREYDRLGLKFPDSYEILNRKVSQIIIPVAPGRSIATLIEVACKVYLCQEKGFFAPEELLKKLDFVLSGKTAPKGKNEK